MALVGSDGQENMIFYNLLHAEWLSDYYSRLLSSITLHVKSSHSAFDSLFNGPSFPVFSFFIVFIFCGSVSLEVFPLGRRERGGVLLSHPNTSIFFAAHYEKEFIWK